MRVRKLLLLVTAFALLSLLGAQCGATPTPERIVETVIVTKEVEVAGETVVETVIVEVEGVKVYHAGDTDFIPEMKDFDVDIALLPVSGTYVMRADQAVEAALAINPKLAIPMHYGAIVGDEQDALDFEKALEGKIPVLVLQKE